MVSMNRILIIAISFIALVSLAGAASAQAVSGTTLHVDKIQRNGDYIGTPVVVSGDTKKVGYSYDFYPDGTYTLFGTITSPSNGSNNVVVPMLVGSFANGSFGYAGNFVIVRLQPAVDMYYAAGPNGQYRVYGWTKPSSTPFSVTVNSRSDKLFLFWDFGPVNLDGIGIVDEGDVTQHTVDQGPMSNAVAIYANGKFNFGNSTLYSFAQ